VCNKQIKEPITNHYSKLQEFGKILESNYSIILIQILRIVHSKVSVCVYVCVCVGRRGQTGVGERGEEECLTRLAQVRYHLIHLDVSVDALDKCRGS
jgi:hypothetical protein